MSPPAITSRCERRVPFRINGDRGCNGAGDWNELHRGDGLIAAEAQLRVLMLAALAGDAPAYRALMAALLPPLRRYFARRLEPGIGEAEDLVQETLIAIHQRRGTYDASQPLTAWVYAIARYKLIDYLRRARLRRTLPLEAADGLFSPDEAAAALAKRDLDLLLETLPEKSRSLIRGMKIEGLSGKEVAAAAGMTETAVKVGVHRGLKALARRISGAQ
jgi:RNA polymerase sigma-70 factor (ECF subfamily)